MAIERRIWTPDTCGSYGCRFAVWLDNSLPSADIVFNLDSVIKIGIEHNGLKGPELFNVVIAEQGLKSGTQREIEAIEPQLRGFNFIWDFSVARVLLVSFDLPSRPIRGEFGRVLSEPQKHLLRQRVNALFGLNKVVVS